MVADEMCPTDICEHCGKDILLVEDWFMDNEGVSLCGKCWEEVFGVEGHTPEANGTGEAVAHPPGMD